jgi:hypothetical protein
MAEKYPVFHFDSESKLLDEKVGDKPKLWLHSSTYNNIWLFKRNHKIPRDYWAEKISAEVAELLEIEHATTELAVFDGKKGTISRSFVHTSHEITDIEFPLTHANELLKGLIPEYDTERRFGQVQHTLSNIWLTLERNIANQRAIEATKRQFARYLILDALIANVDRHHTNWGLQATSSKEDGASPYFLAPSFDHASSLGRDLTDEDRERMISNGQVCTYVNRGRGKVYWQANERRAPSPLDLVKRSVSIYPEIFQPELWRLDLSDEGSLSIIVENMPGEWMTRLERDFTMAMMRFSLNELRKVIQ